MSFINTLDSAVWPVLRVAVWSHVMRRGRGEMRDEGRDECSRSRSSEGGMIYNDNSDTCSRSVET